MRRLGKRFAVVLLLGVVGVALALVGAAIGDGMLALAGLALALLAILGAQAWHRLEFRRLARIRREPSDQRNAVAARAPRLEEQVQDWRHISGDMERIAADSVADIRGQVNASVRAVTAEVAALLQLMQGTTEAEMLRPEDPASPTQIVRALGVLRQRSAHRILTVGLGMSNHWFAQDLTTTSGRMVAVFDSSRWENEKAAARLRELLHATRTAQVVRICSAPSVLPDIEGAYLPWLDLGEVDKGEKFDAVVVAVASERERRAALPVLELLRSRLAAGGCVILLDQDPEQHVALAWTVVDGWRALTEPAPTTTFVPES